MKLSNRSVPRAVTLRSAPNKSRDSSELPPLPNLSYRSYGESEYKVIDPKQNLSLNNYVKREKNLSLDLNSLPSLQIEALHDLCNQLVKGQEELKKRLEQQEILIESLRKTRKESKPKIATQDPILPKRIENTPRRIQGFTPRGSEEAGFFTFRPSDTSQQKTKFPREIFSRKSRTKPQ